MSDNYIFEFYERLDKAARASGMSKTEIARQGDFDRKALMRRGCNSMLGGYILGRFCGVTGVSADYLLGFTSEIFRKGTGKNENK